MQVQEMYQIFEGLSEVEVDERCHSGLECLAFASRFYISWHQAVVPNQNSTTNDRRNTPGAGLVHSSLAFSSAVYVGPAELRQGATDGVSASTTLLRTQDRSSECMRRIEHFLCQTCQRSRYW